MVNTRDKLLKLNEYFNSEDNNLTILYGRSRTGKSSLIKEFIKDKNYVYFDAIPAADFEIRNNFRKTIKKQCGINAVADSFRGVLWEFVTAAESPIVLVVEEFSNIVKNDSTFMETIADIIQHKELPHKLMVILTSSSIAWVENSMVKTIKSAAFAINAFMKIRPLKYQDMVNLYPEADAKNLMCMYAITGGVPYYALKWDINKSLKYNICNLFLKKDGMFYGEVTQLMKAEFRETGIYNTLLYCLASGKNKLNEIYEYTGYGRDKISVYLGNLIEREFVEKIFSFEDEKRLTTRKGLYKIKDATMNFWFRFIYPHFGELGMMEPEKFYDEYIAGEFNDFMLETLILVAGEFLEIMNEAGKLSIKGEYKGRWYGKKGDIHIIYEDNEEHYLVAQAYVGERPVSHEMIDKLITDCQEIGIIPVSTFLFSASGYDEALMEGTYNSITMIRIEDL